MLTVWKIIAFELLAGVSLNFDEHTCDFPSTSSKVVLGFHIRLREMIHNSTFLILMEHYHKSGALQT